MLLCLKLSQLHTAAYHSTERTTSSARPFNENVNTEQCTKILIEIKSETYWLWNDRGKDVSHFERTHLMSSLKFVRGNILYMKTIMIIYEAFGKSVYVGIMCYKYNTTYMYYN